MPRRRNLRLRTALAFAALAVALVGCSSHTESDLNDLVRPRKSEFVDTSNWSFPKVNFGAMHAGETVRREVTFDVSGLKDGTHLTVGSWGSGLAPESLKIENGCEIVPAKECTVAFQLTATETRAGSTETTIYLKFVDEKERSRDLELAYTAAGSPITAASEDGKGLLDFGTQYAPTMASRSLIVKNISSTPVPIGLDVVSGSYGSGLQDPGVTVDVTDCKDRLAPGATCKPTVSWNVRRQKAMEAVAVKVTANGVETARLNLQGVAKEQGYLRAGSAILRLNGSGASLPTTVDVGISNAGDQPLQGVNAAIVGDDAGLVRIKGTVCTEIAAGSTCHIVLEGPATLPDAGISAFVRVAASNTESVTLPIAGGNVMGLQALRFGGTGYGRDDDPAAGTITSKPGGIDCGDKCAAVFRASAAGVTLTATPANGYRFVRWNEAACPGAGACVVPASGGDRSVTAIFEKQP